MSRFAWSKAAAWLVSLLVTFWVFYRPAQNPVSYDVLGYYYYLPSYAYNGGVVTDNVDWLKKINETYKCTPVIYQVYRLENGRWLDRYPMGMALMYAPGFAAGHLLAKAGFGKADGFSEPYRWSLIVCCWLYAVLGIVMLRKVLLKFFEERVAAIVILLIGLGTNYFHNAAFQGSMPHALLFTLYTLLLWCVIRWHEDQGWKHLLGAAFICGLMLITRPTHLLALLIPFLWNVYNFKTLREKALLLWQHKWTLVAGILTFLLVCAPQLIYWHKVTGEWLYYSYGDNPGEGLDFDRPHLPEVLFSFRKGWLVYTPLMALSLLGMIWLFRMRREIFSAVVMFFGLHLYVVSSWSCWWYAGSFGQRALVEDYALLSLSLGCFIAALSGMHPWIRRTTYTLIILLGALNLFQTWQYESSILHPSRMTREYYFANFLRTEATPVSAELLLVNRTFENEEVFTDPAGKYRPKTLLNWDFEQMNDPRMQGHLSDSVAKQGRYSLKLEGDFDFTPSVRIPYFSVTDQDHAWLRLEFQMFPSLPLNENRLTAVIEFTHEGKAYKSMHKDLSAEKYKAGEWNTVTLDYLSPEVRSKADELVVYLWLQNRKAIYIDEMKLTAFERK